MVLKGTLGCIPFLAVVAELIGDLKICRLVDLFHPKLLVPPYISFPQSTTRKTSFFLKTTGGRPFWDSNSR